MGQNKRLIFRCKFTEYLLKGVVLVFIATVSGVIGNEWNSSRFAQIKREDEFTIKAYKKFHHDDSVEIEHLNSLIKSQELLLSTQNKVAKDVKHIDKSIDTLIENTPKKRK